MREGAAKSLKRAAGAPSGKPLGASPGASTFPGRGNWDAREFPAIKRTELRDCPISRPFPGQCCDGTCRKSHLASKGSRSH